MGEGGSVPPSHLHDRILFCSATKALASTSVSLGMKFRLTQESRVSRSPTNPITVVLSDQCCSQYLVGFDSTDLRSCSRFVWLHGLIDFLFVQQLIGQLFSDLCQSFDSSREPGDG